MVSYGYANSARQPAPYSPEQRRDREERDLEQAQRDAYSRWLTEQSLALQLAGQAYQNQAQGIYNRNQLSQAEQSRAATRYGLGQDILSTQQAIERGKTDLAQQRLSNIRYGYTLQRDLNRAKNQERTGIGTRAASMFR